MAFSPDRPTHLVTATRTGAVLIGICRGVNDLRTAIANFIHDWSECCHPFSWT